MHSFLRQISWACKSLPRESYAKGDVDFKSQLTKIAGQNPDVLFIPVYYEDVALIVQQAKSAGISAQLLGADGWDGVLDKVEDKSVLEGAMYCCGFLLAEPGCKSTGVYPEIYGQIRRSAEGILRTGLRCGLSAGAGH